MHLDLWLLVSPDVFEQQLRHLLLGQTLLLHILAELVAVGTHERHGLIVHALVQHLCGMIGVVRRRPLIDVVRSAMCNSCVLHDRRKPISVCKDGIHMPRAYLFGHASPLLGYSLLFR